MTDRGHEIDFVLRTLKSRLENPYGILTDITIHNNHTYTISANKKTGLTVQHATIHGDNLISVMWQLIKYIEETIEEWIEQKLY